MYYTQTLHRTPQQTPGKPATICGARRRSYAEVTDRVARLAGALRSLGLQTNDRVAMLSLNSDRYAEFMFAVPWAGGVVVPCNIRWSAAEILYSLEDAGVSVLIVDDAFLKLAQNVVTDAKSLRALIHCGDGETPVNMHSYEGLIAAAEPIADSAPRDDNLLGIFYTGGTTGFPKGVMLSHNNLSLSSMSLMAEGIAPDNAVYLHAAPMFHIADVGMSAAHWMRGNSHIFIPSFTPQAVIEAIERERVTHTLLVPTMIQMLVDSPLMDAGHDLSSLKTIIYGASPISEAVLERAMNRLPGVEFAQAYGMTELSPLATLNPPCNHSSEGRANGRIRAAGRASLCTEVRIVDPQGKEVPRGTVGEVAVRGPNVMLGYWNKPDATAEALKDGWMHTGDGAYMDADGYVFIVDRVKDMIISGGENIYSAEVENAIAQHPEVAACAVIGIPDEQWGEAVHAVVVPKPGAQIVAADLIAHCKRLIAGYKCPRSVESMAALPLSGAGKVLKTVLREPHWQGRTRNVS